MVMKFHIYILLKSVQMSYFPLPLSIWFSVFSLSICCRVVVSSLLLHIISLHPRISLFCDREMVPPLPHSFRTLVSRRVSLFIFTYCLSVLIEHRGERTTSFTTWSSEELTLLDFWRRRDFFQFPHPSRYP